MGKTPLSELEVKKIRELRKTGHSLGEIKNVTKRGYGTIFRYIKDIPILPEYEELWKIKRGGSRKRSQQEWKVARLKAKDLITDVSVKERMIVLACLYWGEGNKTELSLINSDPTLIKVMMRCLKDLGILTSEIKVCLRLFEDIDKKRAVVFWLRVLDLPQSNITRFEIIKGKKKGKLEYGMCRIRVQKSARHFKLIMSMIDLIRENVK